MGESALSQVIQSNQNHDFFDTPERLLGLPTVYTSLPLVQSGPNLHTHADSSPNGSELNKNQPRVTQEGFGGGV